ncbi:MULTISPECIES: sensor domain-containing diguanylate cyclase [unclassified Methylobacterium]|uniref:sensor domain-containing diguanylate cyclase n=1 Tax=unclassified Methylobacterium TaxID=2615210 RepID=UPI0011C1E5DE|nr:MULTISPECIES: sensor domain-containing diguanylate cyclase [unclassified Methylobacterium]QEE41331.1 GGDEF domain-containing protein [Methylobacterium sp. WL1]TXN57761.1 GGDEF domain-containing protein [Methylobacterium sp. WL2]
MASLRCLTHRFNSARTWMALGVLAPVGMLVISGFMLLDLRQDAWDKAEQTSKNLLQVLERDIARNIEMYDLSLRAVVENLKVPGLDQISPELRQLVLFDRAATAQDMGVMLVLDENGDSIIDAGAVPARKISNADRSYFLVHKAQANLGLYISEPLVSRLTTTRMLALSRRINKPDGSFGGVVVGTLKLSYFTRLFSQIDLGRDGAINLYLRDGTRVMRQPYAEADIGVNIAGAPTFKGFLREHNGSFVETSARDGIQRHYTFTRIGDLPLILNVALSTDEIEAEWRMKALTIGVIVLMLCGLTIALSLLFGRELRRREAMQAELERLSLTDALTRLPNRRAFEDTGARSWKAALRSGKPLSLLIVDADHFKRFNDRYGHQVGDEVLQGLARCLSASVHRPHDLVCRVGGEEFAVLLPDTDQAGALRIAEKVHAEVLTLTFGSAGIGAGAVTVSIGLVTTIAGGAEVTALTDLYRLADGALYEAKAGGRNQTRCAKMHAAPTASQKRELQIISRS